MARSKEFGKGIAALFGEDDEDIPQPSKQNESNSKEIEKKVDPEKRATFIVSSDHLEKLKGVAFWERKKIKEVLAEALDEYFKGLDKDGTGSYIENAMQSYRSPNRR